jgi:hypothetical protein
MFGRWKKSLGSPPEADTWREDSALPVCCFCGGDIHPLNADPLTIRITTQQGKWQMWFAHGVCFKARLASDAAVDLLPVHF